MMVRLIYVSRAEASIDRQQIGAIVACAKTHNPANGITGVLCYTGNLFLQVLEGGREAVNKLYGALGRDARHSDLTLIQYTEISERQFANWTMGEVNLDRVNPSVLLRHSELPTLDPYRLDAQACVSLLHDLASSATVVSRTNNAH